MTVKANPPGGSDIEPPLPSPAPPPGTVKLEDCPNRRAHAKDEPQGYLGWHEWAEAKGRTHRQVRCPGCNLFAIWVER